MKNREKFFIIFMITIIILSITSVVRGYIEFNKLSDEQAALWKEIENGKSSDKYSFGIEDGIKQHMIEEPICTEREKALNSYVSSVNTQYLLEYTNLNARMIEIINLVFYSLSISFFIWCMLTLEYKDKKQYTLDNIGALLIFVMLWVLNNALGLGDNLLFWRNPIEILPILYVMFFIGNIIKNAIKRRSIKYKK